MISFCVIVVSGCLWFTRGGVNMLCWCNLSSRSFTNSSTCTSSTTTTTTTTTKTTDTLLHNNYQYYNTGGITCTKQKEQLCYGSWPYWMPVTFTVIQSEWFSFHRKGLCNFLLVINCNLGRISHRFRDMASFLLKNTHFSYPLYSTPKIKMFPLH